MISEEQIEPQRKPRRVRKKRKNGRSRKRPPAPMPLSWSERLPTWVTRPFIRSAEKTLERAFEKLFRGLIFGCGVLVTAAFAYYYAGVIPVPLGIPSSSTIQYQRGK